MRIPEPGETFSVIKVSNPPSGNPVASVIGAIKKAVPVIENKIVQYVDSKGLGNTFSQPVIASTHAAAAAYKVYVPPGPAILSQNRFDNVVLMGQGLTKTLDPYIIDIDVSLSTDQVSQVVIHLFDPSYILTASGVFAAVHPLTGTSTNSAVVSFQGMTMAVTGITLGGNENVPTVDITLHPAAVRVLKAMRDPNVMTLVSRSDYVATSCISKGIQPVCEESAQQAQVSRDIAPYVQPVTLVNPDEIPSEWTTFQRLAGELGWKCFAMGNILYFCSTTYLVQNSRVVRVKYDPTLVTLKDTSQEATYNNIFGISTVAGKQRQGPIQVAGTVDPTILPLTTLPSVTIEEDTYTVNATITLDISYVSHFAPGFVCQIVGLPGLFGQYSDFMVSDINYTLAGTDITVTLTTPVQEAPQDVTGTFINVNSLAINGASTVGAGSYSANLGLPVCGITMDNFMAAIRRQESGNYSAGAGSSGPSGAYQYIPSTWKSTAGAAIYAQYHTAGQAPPAVQDQVARNEFQNALNSYGGDWGRVAVHHIYPVAADSPTAAGHDWRTYRIGSNPTAYNYALSVLQKAGGISCAGLVGTGAKGTKLATDFVLIATQQQNKSYVVGTPPHVAASAIIADTSPATFDCSGLVRWAALQCGVGDIGSVSGTQFAYCKARGKQISVAQAMNTRGALLFIGTNGITHVAISMGDGKNNMAARGSHVTPQVGITSASASTWSVAALIPGLEYF